MIDLSSGPLAVPFAGRVMATATVQLRNPSAEPREARCKLQILNTLDPQAVTSDMGQTFVSDLPGDPGHDVTVTVSGGGEQAGRHLQRVARVRREPARASLSAERANLQVWAAG